MRVAFLRNASVQDKSVNQKSLADGIRIANVGCFDGCLTAVSSSPIARCRVHSDRHCRSYPGCVGSLVVARCETETRHRIRAKHRKPRCPGLRSRRSSRSVDCGTGESRRSRRRIPDCRYHQTEFGQRSHTNRISHAGEHHYLLMFPLHSRTGTAIGRCDSHHCPASPARTSNQSGDLSNPRSLMRSRRMTQA